MKRVVKKSDGELSFVCNGQEMLRRRRRRRSIYLVEVEVDVDDDVLVELEVEVEVLMRNERAWEGREDNLACEQ